MHRRTASTVDSPTLAQGPSLPSPALEGSSTSRSPSGRAPPPPIALYATSSQLSNGLLSPATRSPSILQQQQIKRRASDVNLAIGEQLVRYLVRTSDAVDVPRVDVLAEEGGRTIWGKTRELHQHTIVSKLEDLDHPSISYSLTRPITHFSLAISSPLFPRSSSIPLRVEPLPDEDGGGVEIEVIVSCRVDLERGLPPPTPTLTSPSTATISSIATSSAFTSPTTPTTYPPAPPSRFSTISASSSRTSTSSLSPTVREATIASQSLRFTVLPAPHPLFHQPPGSHNHHLSVPPRFGGGIGPGGRDLRGEERIPLSPTPRSLDVGFGEQAELGGPTGAVSSGLTWGRKLGRVLGGIVSGVKGVAGRNLEGAAKYRGKSFHLLPPPHLFPALPPPAINPRPILTFHDTTPFLSATTQGVLIVDEALVRVLGVERGFWIAVALAALEIEEDREGYLAAQDG
ncbi:hypothetical protein BDY24DRAFT_393394 [Mrakia frigida]|uniref:uncharacterized protein n=1 Tax=Mrakia frigida TaxID=29902 RepID=UPI003FCC09E6